MKLPEALRETVRRVRSGEVWYQWTNSSSCNCGILAQTILGKNSAAVMDDICETMLRSIYPMPVWSDAENFKCQITDLPNWHIARVLVEAGLPTRSMSHLEHLNDPAILDRMGVTRLRKMNRYDVSSYMLAYADYLDEQSPIEQQASAPSEDLIIESMNRAVDAGTFDSLIDDSSELEAASI